MRRILRPWYDLNFAYLNQMPFDGPAAARVCNYGSLVIVSFSYQCTSVIGHVT